MRVSRPYLYEWLQRWQLENDLFFENGTDDQMVDWMMAKIQTESPEPIEYFQGIPIYLTHLTPLGMLAQLLEDFFRQELTEFPTIAQA